MGWLLLCLHLFLFHFPSSDSLCHPHDSFALLQFNTSFTIDTTDASPGCNDAAYPKTATWVNGTDCCSWLGVTCHRISGHVIGLDLSCSGLQGEIHANSTLFHLSHLQSLNLAFNDFSQSQLLSQFGEFAGLTHLNLSNSNFEGEIPSTISHLSKLISLDLSLRKYYSYLQLKWKESTWKKLLQNATGLRELVLDETDMSSIRISPLNMSSSLVTLILVHTGLTGNLTSDILCLPNLQHLSLSRNYGLENQLPNLSCRATSLSVLDLSECQFQGSVPPSFSNLTHLTSLDLAYNNLNGSIPSSLLTLPRLTVLELSHNQLNGQIRDVFHQSNTFQIQLIRLNLAGNEFKGQIASSLLDLTYLSYLDCSYNKFEGPLPNKITRFSNLSELNLSGNLLNGRIPSWCLSLPSLVGLYLSNNQFTGHISAISSHSLEHLHLNSNKLQGNIPKSIFSLVNLTHLNLSSNILNGPVYFPLFSKLQSLRSLSFSHNSQLSLNFYSNGNYSFSSLVTLELSSLNLIEFSQSGKFPSLSYLDLSNNQLNGRVSNWLHEMSSVSYLDLSQNRLTSSLDQFSRSYQLIVLDLSGNLLAGHISSSICNLSSLRILDLSYNNLTGIIPQCLTNLSSLLVLDVQMNKLFGILPSTFSKDNWFSTLNLNGNQLEGPLPKSLSKCTNLEVLNLGNNQIEDTFPHWLETLPNLKVLILRANKMQGPVATSKAQHPFPNLIILDISSNNFSGPIPAVYIKSFEAMKNIIPDEVDSGVEYIEPMVNPIPVNMQSVRYSDSLTETINAISVTLKKIPTIIVDIDLSNNKFEGEIPKVIGDVRALIVLNLSHNRLNGPIPQSMGNLTNLESLDLSSNMLTGRIPTELINLNFLELLNISQNHLEGEIPQGKQFNTFSYDSYEGNLGLCGLPLPIKCSNNHEEHPPPLSTPQHEEKFGFGWKPVAIGYGCGMVFGVGIGYCVLLIGKPQWLVRMIGGNPNRRVKRTTN